MKHIETNPQSTSASGHAGDRKQKRNEQKNIHQTEIRPETRESGDEMHTRTKKWNGRNHTHMRGKKRTPRIVRGDKLFAETLTSWVRLTPKLKKKTRKNEHNGNESMEWG